MSPDAHSNILTRSSAILASCSYDGVCCGEGKKQRVCENLYLSICLSVYLSIYPSVFLCDRLALESKRAGAVPDNRISSRPKDAENKFVCASGRMQATPAAPRWNARQRFESTACCLEFSHLPAAGNMTPTTEMIDANFRDPKKHNKSAADGRRRGRPHLEVEKVNPRQDRSRRSAQQDVGIELLRLIGKGSTFLCKGIRVEGKELQEVGGHCSRRESGL